MTGWRWSIPASDWTTSPTRRGSDPNGSGRRRRGSIRPRPPCGRSRRSAIRKSDVRHLLLTHLDRDHAGGIPDFPNAKVHVHRREYDMAVTRRTPAPKGRYITDQWKHDPQWAFYGEGGEDWFGFKGVRALGDREPDILMIPLPGHTLGHCGIAVRSRGQMAAARRRCLFLPWSDAGFAANAAGARHVSAPRRHGSRHAHRKTRNGYGRSRPITAMP